jgi:hypothetical protein
MGAETRDALRDGFVLDVAAGATGSPLTADTVGRMGTGSCGRGRDGELWAEPTEAHQAGKSVGGAGRGRR